VPEAALCAQVRYITVIVDIGGVAGEFLGAFLIPEKLRVEFRLAVCNFYFLGACGRT